MLTVERRPLHVQISIEKKTTFFGGAPLTKVGFLSSRTARSVTMLPTKRTWSNSNVEFNRKWSDIRCTQCDSYMQRWYIVQRWTKVSNQVCWLILNKYTNYTKGGSRLHYILDVIAFLSNNDVQSVPFWKQLPYACQQEASHLIKIGNSGSDDVSALCFTGEVPEKAIVPFRLLFGKKHT